MDEVECTIFFDRPNAAYYPEERITGKIVVKIPPNVEVKSITLTLIGVCLTQSAKIKYFYNSYSNNNLDEYGSPVFGEKKEIFSIEKILYYILGGKNLFVERDNVYLFDELLMPDLPTSIDTTDHSIFTDLGLVSLLPENSYIGKRGMILYTAQVLIDFINNARPPKYFAKEFFICSKVDLNRIPGASDPFVYEERKEFKRLFNKIAPVTIRLELPTKGYVSKKLIPITLHVDNQCEFSISMALKLKACIILNVKEQIIVLSKTINIIFENVSVGANSNLNIERNYTIPNLPPSYSNTSISNISTSYSFEVKAVAHRMLKLWKQNWNVLRFTTDEIYIGTIDLENDIHSEVTSVTTLNSDKFIDSADEAENVNF